MPYKTLVLHMLEDRPQLYEQLRQERLLLPALDRYSLELKSSHIHWMDQLRQAKPESDVAQIASEALEFALKDLEARLSSELPPANDGTFSLDDAMRFLRVPIPPA